MLSDGWWRGQVGFTREIDSFGDAVAALVQIEAVDDAGTRTVVATDGTWTWTSGPIVAADLIEGQREDRRLPAGPPRPVAVHEVDLTRLTSSPAPPTRRIEDVAPVSITEPRRARRSSTSARTSTGGYGSRGSARRGRASASPTASGSTPTAPSTSTTSPRSTSSPASRGRPDRSTRSSPAGETVARDDDVFEPRHTTHGFQFVQVDGRPDPLTPGDLRGVVVHTDLRRTGWFRCSDDPHQRLHDATVWSFRGNACEIPTDCPQRERAGWTGDWQIFVPSAAFLYDVAGFSARWLRDLAADQWPDGRVPNFVPDPSGPRAHDHPVASFITGSSGWGDAAVIVPWELWVAYGDDRFLADAYDSGSTWVGFAAARAAEGRHATRQARRRPRPRAPRRGTPASTGGSGANRAATPRASSPSSSTWATSPPRSSTRLWRGLLGRTARILGRDGDADRWDELAAHVRDAWCTEFVADDGTLTPDTQANHVRALALGLVPDELRAATADRLVALVREAGDHLGDGLPRHPRPASRFWHDAGQRRCRLPPAPSRTPLPCRGLAAIDAGATTVWENWEGIDAEGLGSLNHYSKGAVVGFLHRFVAGASADDHRLRTVPRIETGARRRATWPGATLDSSRGASAVALWTLDGDRFALDVVVPPGSEATVVLPDGTTRRPPAASPTSSVHCGVRP